MRWAVGTKRAALCPSSPRSSSAGPCPLDGREVAPVPRLQQGDFLRLTGSAPVSLQDLIPLWARAEDAALARGHETTRRVPRSDRRRASRGSVCGRLPSRVAPITRRSLPRYRHTANSRDPTGERGPGTEQSASSAPAAPPRPGPVLPPAAPRSRAFAPGLQPVTGRNRAAPPGPHQHTDRPGALQAVPGPPASAERRSGPGAPGAEAGGGAGDNPALPPPRRSGTWRG